MIRRVAIIAAGAFGETMIEALATPEERDLGVEIVASHRRPERRSELQERYGIRVYADNREACRVADVICPMARPAQMAELMEEIGPCIRDEQFVAAGAASLPMAFYRRYLPSKCTLAWVFPTAFMKHRGGFLAMCPEPGSDPQRICELEAYWGRFCKEIITVSEEAMDTFVLLHAAGQTFFWPIIKAYVEFGAANGFTREEAQAVTLNTLESMGKWLGTQNASPFGLEALMDEFSVPGSLTGAGLAVLRRNYVESLYAQTLEAGMTQARNNRDAAMGQAAPES